MTRYIQVELAVGWPTYTWSDGHYVYVLDSEEMQSEQDLFAAAIEMLTNEFNAAGTECAFITGYNVENELFFTKEGTPLRPIDAEAHTDDHASEVSFDATPYFEQASDEDLLKLAACDWGGDYAADQVAISLADQNRELAQMFAYIEVAGRVKDMGFECHVDAEDALAWIALNRPELATKLAPAEICECGRAPGDCKTADGEEDHGDR